MLSSACVEPIGQNSFCLWFVVPSLCIEAPPCSLAVLLPDVAGNREANRGALTADTVSPQIQGAFRQDSGRSSTGSGRQQVDILSGAGEPRSSGSHHEDMVKAPEAYR